MNQFPAILFAILVVAHNYQTVNSNSGHRYSQDIEINMENIRNIYSSVPLLKNSPHNGAIETQACHQDFCCQFNIEYQNGYDPSNTTSLGYSVFAFKGLATFSETIQGAVEMCGINKLKQKHGEESDKFAEDTIRFGITGVSKNRNSTLYPLTQRINDDKFTQYKTNKQQFKCSLDENENIRFEYFSGSEQDTFETVLIVGTNVQLENFKTDINVLLDTSNFKKQLNEEEQSVMDYLYIRLQIIAFVVTIYCLEQM